MVAAGTTNREIGEALFISESTAGVHVSNIMAKLGVGSRTEAAAWAVRAGLVESSAQPPAAAEPGAGQPTTPPRAGWRACELAGAISCAATRAAWPPSPEVVCCCCWPSPSA